MKPVFIPALLFLWNGVRKGLVTALDITRLKEARFLRNYKEGVALSTYAVLVCRGMNQNGNKVVDLAPMSGLRRTLNAYLMASADLYRYYAVSLKPYGFSNSPALRQAEILSSYYKRAMNERVRDNIRREVLMTVHNPTGEMAVFKDYFDKVTDKDVTDAVNYISKLPLRGKFIQYSQSEASSREDERQFRELCYQYYRDLIRDLKITKQSE